MSIIAKGQVASLVVLIIFVVLLVIVSGQTKAGKTFYFKSLPGLDAIDEAVGRATEMGRPIVANPGIVSLRRHGPLAIAAITVATHVARLAARAGAKIIVPVAYADTLQVIHENLREAYVLEGVPDDFDPDYSVRWISSNEFSFCSALQGIASREKPASNLMIGLFAAEAMILAETFSRINAFQIGGLTNLYQIPFFVAVCDYMLVGSELYAAGAYLSQDPDSVGSIRVEDMFKLTIVAVIVVGALLSLMGNTVIQNILAV